MKKLIALFVVSLALLSVVVSAGHGDLHTRPAIDRLPATIELDCTPNVCSESFVFVSVPGMLVGNENTSFVFI